MTEEKRRPGRPKKERIVDLSTIMKSSVTWNDVPYSSLPFLFEMSPRPGFAARTDSRETAQGVLGGALGWVEESVHDGALERETAMQAIRLLMEYVENGDDTLAWCIALAFEAGKSTALLNLLREGYSLNVGRKTLANVSTGGKLAHVDPETGETPEDRHALYCKIIQDVKNDNPGISNNSAFNIALRRLRENGIKHGSPSTLWKAWKERHPTKPSK
ncbi:MAG: hypothetical protein GXP47_09390 [Acidobacteria bacterium]|nr:hypothetical protein [Acidobacteriota bacterium]